MNDTPPLLAAEMITKAARLVRAVRAEGQYPAASLRVLSIIDERGPSRVTTLAGIDQCSQPTMTGTVNTLEKAGLVVRSPDPADARAHLVHLTEAGAARLVEYRTHIGEVTLGWFAASDVAEPEAALHQIVGLLDTLLEASRSHTPQDQ